MGKARGAKHLNHRIQVGKILEESTEPLTAKQISERLHDSHGSRRRLTRVRLTANSVSQMLRGAKGVKAEMQRRYESNANPRKVFQMESHEEYKVWIESKRRPRR